MTAWQKQVDFWEKRVAGYRYQDKKDTYRLMRFNNKDYITIKKCIEIYLAQLGKCLYCGCRVKTRGKKQIDRRTRPDPKLATIDRIENHKAHVLGNCVIACYRCNVRRGGDSVEVFKRKTAKFLGRLTTEEEDDMIDWFLG